MYINIAILNIIYYHSMYATVLQIIGVSCRIILTWHDATAAGKQYKEYGQTDKA